MLPAGLVTKKGIKLGFEKSKKRAAILQRPM
jgi:hypothetical protein